MKKLLTTIFLFVAINSFATIFYISPTGNDATGNGTAVAPWKTLYKATTSVRTAGDIIHVNAGTYTETQSSNLAAGVSLEGDGATSVIQASFSTTYQAIIYASSPEGTNGNQTVSNLNFAGRSLTSWCLQIQGRSNVSVFNCTFTNFKQRGVIWGGREDNGDAPPTIYATGNKFYNNTMTNCAGFDGTYGYGCLNIGGQDGMLIYNNNITTTGTTPGWPIKLWNDGYVKGIKIYNNVLKRPPFPYQYNGIGNYFDFAIELFHQQGIEIYGNTIEGSIDLNWQTKGAYAYAAYIHDNVIGRSTQAAHCETGVWLEFESEYVTIENNTFKNISQPIMFSLRPGSYMNNITIQKNLAYNIGKTDGTKEGTAIGIIVNDNSTNYTANNWFVYNNTFTAITGANSPYFGIQFPGGNKSSNVKINNNILTNFDYYVLSSSPAGNLTGFEVKDNCLYNNGSNNTFEFNGGTPKSYTNSGNLNVNPSLVNWLVTASSPLFGKNIGYGGTVTPPPASCEYVYSAWGECVNGVQSRTVVSATPAGCVGTPILTQTCTPPVKTVLMKIHVYTDNTISKAVKVNKNKTLVKTIILYTDKTVE